MTALSASKNTQRREAVMRHLPVAADAVIHQGALVVLNAGYLEPGSVATGLIAVGRAEERVDNTGGVDGAVLCKVRGDGAFAWVDNADATTITRAHIGSTVYVQDDQTVTLTTTGRSVAGKIFDVDAEGVHVTPAA